MHDQHEWHEGMNAETHSINPFGHDPHEREGPRVEQVARVNGRRKSDETGKRFAELRDLAF